MKYSIDYLLGIRFVSIIIALYCLIKAFFYNEIAYPYWLLSTCYALLVCITQRNSLTYKNALGMIFLNVLMFLRYAILPLGVYLNGEIATWRFSGTYSYVDDAIIFML